MNTGTVLERQPNAPLVTDMMARVEALAAEGLTAADRARWERHFKLSYYYGGLMVAAVVTPARLTVVASGPADEVGKVLRGMTRVEVEQLTMLFPDPLDAVISDLLGRKVAVAG